MKKHILTLIGLTLIGFFFIISCDNNTQKKEGQREGGLVVGSIADNTKTTANLVISLDEAKKLMQQNNRLTLENFNYTYTRAWIEIIETEKNKYSYYLGLEANLESKNNEKAYSCYSVYTELEINNTNLEFYANAIQHSCTGKCCGNCKLVLFKNNLGCKCESPSNESDCDGQGRCKHDKSQVLTTNEKKSDMI